MRFLGGKAKIARRILDAVLKDRAPNQLYVEPFVGGCNVIDKATGPRWGNDTDAELINMWIAVQQGWEPPESISEDEYRALRADPDADPALRAFAAFAASWGGKKWGGYARDAEGCNYAAVGRRTLLRQAPAIQGVIFTALGYDQMLIPPGSLVYCDPPYADTTKYASGAFDHVAFWAWVREQSQASTVFVSEFTAPEDFVPVIEFPRTNYLNRKKVVEKLWRIVK